MTLAGSPTSQDDPQKEAFCPSSRVTFVAALKRFRSTSSFGVSEPTHGLSGEAHSCQSHRSLRALENFSKFRIPRPPRTLGRHTLSQLTLHLPPLTISVQFYSIPRLILSKALRIPLSSLMAVNRKILIDDSTDLTRAVQPARLRNLPCHGSRRDAILSM